ncbi:hypothetical protein FK220_003395 [Flavobacteriaceae bacterium TP-CH-4]|uniref:Uncharacterized protein n=1 Tax=Pelagihabitans pacificus TaxID=2696054 RepID=A0A967E5R2_9FLAO|nr:hypothetical protein [Pelagihabitans pacificus]NHF58369.1 hypothetical protein [Pelagihabitans pacificus]
MKANVKAVVGGSCILLKSTLTLIGMLLLVLWAASCSKDDDGPSLPTETLDTQIEAVELMALSYQSFAKAEEDGYAVLSEFNPSPYVPQMGYHYTNRALLDATFEMDKPEILLYVPNEMGVLELVGVEYAVPEALSATPPEGFLGDEDVWELNPNVAGGAWTLHVWVVMDNPNGVFAPSNPNVPSSDPYIKAQEEALKKQLETVTEVALPYQDFSKAEEDGYAVLSEFNPSPYVPYMGYHYTNGNLLDGVFELEKPEILLYVPDEAGNLELVGVEYAVPEALSPNPPEGFIGDADEWELNPNVAGGAWTLHVWVVLENPDGVFAPMNSMVPASDPSAD